MFKSPSGSNSGCIFTRNSSMISPSNLPMFITRVEYAYGSLNRSIASMCIGEGLFKKISLYKIGFRHEIVHSWVFELLVAA